MSWNQLGRGVFFIVEHRQILIKINALLRIWIACVPHTARTIPTKNPQKDSHVFLVNI